MGLGNSARVLAWCVVVGTAGCGSDGNSGEPTQRDDGGTEAGAGGTGGFHAGGGSGGVGGGGSGGVGGTQGGSGGSGATGGQAGSGGSDMEEACDQAAADQCEAFEACFPVNFALNYGDQAGCVAAVSTSCLLQAEATGSATSSTSLAACLESITCETFTGGPPPEACVVEGDLDLAAGCFTGDQCESGRCVRYPGQECGICWEPAEVGEPCVSNDQCTSHFCLGRKCAAWLLEGEACGPGMGFCAFGLNCQEGECQKAPGDGEPCNEGSCGVEESCVEGVCKTIGIAAPGEECGVLEDGFVVCAMPYGCKGGASPTQAGTCEMLPGAGEPCDGTAWVSGPPCRQGFSCRDGMCMAPDPAQCDGPACRPAGVSTFVPSWVPPAPLYQERCDSLETVEMVVTSCFGTSSTTAKCNAALVEAPDCGACVFPGDSASSTGALVGYVGVPWVYLNVEGCVAARTGETDPDDCPAQGEAARQCKIAACKQPCIASGQVDPDWIACQDWALNTVCSDFAIAASTCSAAWTQPGAAAGPCLFVQGETFQQAASRYGWMFCGAAPDADAGTGDAGDDEGGAGADGGVDDSDPD